MLHVLPGIPGHGAPRHAHPLGAVERDVGGDDPRLEHARLGVLASPSEQARGFDVVVTNFLQVVVHDGVAVLVLHSTNDETRKNMGGQT